ncbi:hypothetical protein BDV93DRAFT_350587 [Ceratobasidium sp. AG-I]|nr:hypothetical protein BDV93DRAFT_350587 [Ceratobasidium sp. AG-I]
MPGAAISCKRYLAALSTLVVLAPVSAYTPLARWGQASTIIGQTLYVHGGKTDPSNMYSYSGAPNTNDLLSLDLSSSFAVSDAPWKYVDGSSVMSSSQGPAVAFHSLTAFDSRTMLMFGGDGGSTIASPSSPDSAWLLDISNPDTPTWTQEAESWGAEPTRSIRHAAVGSFGRVWITGGEKADGSNLATGGNYVFQPSVPSFDLLPSDGAPPLLVGHASLLLQSGMLAVFGGYNPATDALVDLSTIWLVDTSQSTPVWSSVIAGGIAPAARRDFAYTRLGDGRVFIHGGTDATMQTIYSDAAVLDITRNPMQWSSIAGFDQAGARRDHMAVGVGSQVLIGFGMYCGFCEGVMRVLMHWRVCVGYGANGPASASLLLFETDDGTWGSTFVPVPVIVPVPIPAPSSASSPSSPTTAANPSASGTATNTGSQAPNQSSVHHSGSQPIATQSQSATGAPNVPSPGPVPTASHSTRASTIGPSHSSGTVPTASDLPPGSTDGPGADLKKIAIGAVLAVIALVGLVLCGAYLAIRKRKTPAWKRGDGSARLISGEAGNTTLDEGYGTTQEHEKGAPLAGSNWDAYQSPRRQWTLLGLGARQTYGRERFDILHDEDAREFGEFRDSRGSMMRDASEGSARTGWGGIVNASATSLRSVGAAFGLGRGSRQPSYGSVRPAGDLEKSEKNASNPFLDASEQIQPTAGPSMPTVALVAPTRPRAVRQESSSSLREVTYHNPFEDSTHDLLIPPDTGARGSEGTRTPEENEGLVGAFRQQDLEDHGHYDDSAFPASAGTYGLAAIGRARSNSDLSPSDHSIGSGNALGSGSGTAVGSASSHEYRQATLLSSAPSAPIRRSDSWWSRFSMSSRRDKGAYQEGFNVVRKLSRNSERPSRVETFLDFRDPNPPPTLRMQPIKETGLTPNTSPEDAFRPPSRSPTANAVATGSHRRSVSSLATMKTADSAALERMGQLDIIQRVRTASTYHAQSLSLDTNPESVDEQQTVGPSTRRPRLSIVPGSPLQSATESGRSHRFSRASTPSLSEDHGTNIASPTELTSVGHSSPTKSVTSPIRARRGTGEVAKRIADYERRMTESNLGGTSPRKSPVGGGEMNELRSPARARVEYGLAQRPELFIANPDGRASPSA